MDRKEGQSDKRFRQSESGKPDVILKKLVKEKQ
jgi:hypothetical protein